MSKVQREEEATHPAREADDTLAHRRLLGTVRVLGGVRDVGELGVKGTGKGVEEFDSLRTNSQRESRGESLKWRQTEVLERKENVQEGARPSTAKSRSTPSFQLRCCETPS